SRGFYQERLAFFSKVVFALCFGFYVLGNLLKFLGPGHSWMQWVTGEPQPFHLAASAVLAGMWWFVSRGRPSLRGLLWIDAAGTVLACAFYAMIGLVDEGRADHATLLACTNTLITRAVLVPSRPGRTFWIGAAAFTPNAAVAYVLYSRNGQLW